MVDLDFAVTLRMIKLPDNFMIMPIPSVMIHICRNMLVRKFLESDCDKIVFLDVDQIFSADVIEKLDSDDKDIVGAMICSRVEPYKACITVKKDNKLFSIFPQEKRLIEVDAIGMGATMIKREVFLKMKKPWFYFSNKRDDIEAVNDDIGEDINFCLDAKKAGFKVYCDTRINPIHIGNKKQVSYKTSLDYNKKLFGDDGYNQLIKEFYEGNHTI